MRVKNSRGDRQFYLLACLLSFGVVFGIRILISEAIRQSLDTNDGKQKQDDNGFRLW